MLVVMSCISESGSEADTAYLSLCRWRRLHKIFIKLALPRPTRLAQVFELQNIHTRAGLLIVWKVYHLAIS